MRQNKYAEYLALLALLITFFGYFSIQVWDIDFWLHIASGRYIVETGAIPDHDPFGIYSSVDAWGQIVLKSQWLGQVFLYEIHHYLGLDGVIVWRAALLTACLWLVYWRCRLVNASLAITFAMTALTGVVLQTFTGERPQLFSFLFLAVMLLLLDAWQQTQRRWLLFLLPPLFVLWANIHGGVLFGVIALGLFGVGTLLQTRIISGKFDAAQVRLMLGVIALCAIASLLAPNGIQTFITTLKTIILADNSTLKDRTSEYATPWSMRTVLPYYWVYLMVAAASIPGFLNKASIRDGLFVVVIAVFSLTGSRYVPLFALAAAPYVALSLSRLLRMVRLPQLIVCLATAIAAFGFLGYGFKQGRVFQEGALESRYPVKAVNIIHDNRLSGKMFNTLNFGGYLDWNLPPASVQIYIDGRLLDISRMKPYTHILWMTSAGKSYFERESFDMVLVAPGNMFTGETYPIISYLLSNPRWQLVHRDSSSFFFIRAAADSASMTGDASQIAIPQGADGS